MIAGLIILTTFVGLFAFLGVQTNKNDRQDSVANNLKAQLQYVTDEVDMLKMGGTNSTLIEVGVCQLLATSSGPRVAFVNYSLFSNSIRNYIVFGNVSTFPIQSYVSGNYPSSSCPFYTNYIHEVLFYISGCTTDLTGTNYTISKFNDILFNPNGIYVGSILKEDQSKIKPDGIFIGYYTQCNQNQIIFETFNIYGYQNVGYVTTNAIGFNILSQNPFTNLSISGPITILLPN